MPHEPRRAVTRHVEFRHDANSAVPRVGDQIADLILGVVKGVGAQLVKFRKFLALHAEALVLREVPMENVHLHGFHAVDISADDVKREEMAGRVDHQSAPREARPVLNGDHWGGKSAGRNIHQLKKGLESMHRAERCRCSEPCARGADIQDVGFILADLLNFLAGVIGLNHERCFCRLGGLEG